MDVGAHIILSLSGLVLVALAAAAAGERLGAPLLLVFLAVGVLAGPEGPGGIVLNNHDLAFAGASGALAIILLDGGLRTRPETLAAGLRPGLSLATFGVFGTAGLTALAAKVAFGIGWAESLLIGAVVSSTDAAAVFSLLSRSEAPVKQRLAATLETESGLNDPAAVFLTFSLAGALARGEAAGPLGLLGLFLWQGIGGVAIGIASGWLLREAKPRLRLAAGLRPVLTLAGGLFAFAVAQRIGASGFVAVYLCGILQARTERGVVESEARTLDGFAWLAQLALFLTLGLLVAPSHVAAIFGPAVAVAAVLILVARPIATFAALAPFKFTFNERLFASWVGLRGATPIFLGLVPAALGAPNANLYFSVAFIVVGVSLVAQGWTTPFAARALGVVEGSGADDEPSLSPLRLTAVAGALTAAAAALVIIARVAAPVAVPTFMPFTVAELESTLAAPGLPIYAARLPQDWDEITDAERRKRLFIDTIAPIVRAENALIAAERAEVEAFLAADNAGRELSLRDQARRDVLARKYGGDYDDLEELLRRIDVTPVSLAVAQAAFTTGWGTSSAAREANALYGRRPEGDEGGPSHFPDLAASVADYFEVLNSHRAFAAFRNARAGARATSALVTGAYLAPHVAPFAADGATFAASVREIIDANDLGRLDSPDL